MLALYSPVQGVESFRPLNFSRRADCSEFKVTIFDGPSKALREEG
jgi:hypothetical protein